MDPQLGHTCAPAPWCLPAPTDLDKVVGGVTPLDLPDSASWLSSSSPPHGHLTHATPRRSVLQVPLRLRGGVCGRNRLWIAAFVSLRLEDFISAVMPTNNVDSSRDDTSLTTCGEYLARGVQRHRACIAQLISAN